MRYLVSLACLVALMVTPLSASADTERKNESSGPSAEEAAGSAQQATGENALQRKLDHRDRAKVVPSVTERWRSRPSHVKGAAPSLELELDSTGLEVTPTGLEELERQQAKQRRKRLGLGIGIGVGVVFVGLLVGGLMAAASVDVD